VSHGSATLIQIKIEQRSVQKDQGQVRQREQGREEQPVILLQRLVAELHDKHEEQGRQPAIRLLVIAGEIQQCNREEKTLHHADQYDDGQQVISLDA
jgi:hypothetical protein